MRKGWAETTFGDLLTLEYGKPLKEADRDGLGYPVFGSAGKVGCHSIPHVWDAQVIVVGRKGTAGTVMWSNTPCSVIDTAFFVRQREEIDLPFLFLLLEKADLPSLSAQTGVPGLNRDRVYGFSVTVPPPLEQLRIVDLITSVETYIGGLQQRTTAIRTSRNALLHELLNGGSDGWVETTLGQVLEISRGGSPRPIQNFITDTEDGINWIKIGDATASSKYIYRTEQKIRPEGASRSRKVSSGDFLLSNSMSFGRPYIMRTTGCIHDGWLLLGSVSRHFDEDFLYNLLISSNIQAQFNSLAAGSGVRNLNIDVVSEICVPLPSKQEQREIAVLLNSFDDIENALKDAVIRAKNLRSGLLSDLLSGDHEIPASYDRVMGAA